MLLHHRWVREFYKGLAVLIITIVAAHVALAQEKRSSKPVRTALDVGWMFAIDATEFFNDYRVYLGGGEPGFDIPTTVSLDLGTFQLNNGMIGISSGYYRAVVRETYDYDPEFKLIKNGPRQTITQEVIMNVIPTMIGIDFFPVQRQFATYVGIAAGLSAIQLYWHETLSPSTDPGARTSGLRYDEWHLAPAVYGRVGISMCFDDKLSKQVRAGINLETGYLYTPVVAPLFQETSKTLVNSPEPSKEYKIQAGGISVRLGFFLIIDGKR